MRTEELLNMQMCDERKCAGGLSAAGWCSKGQG